jgi:hypothetical protein
MGRVSSSLRLEWLRVFFFASLKCPLGEKGGKVWVALELRFKLPLGKGW